MSPIRIAAVALVLLPTPLFAAPARPISFQQRVEARRAIERVLWAHRIWPEGNTTPKPTFEQWAPPGVLEREVEDDLRKSALMAKRWGRPIDPVSLQAELDRMVRDSQSPAILREILEALHGDAVLAAEVLARHALADRLARAAYAYDARIHGAVYERAAAARRRASDLLTLRGFADRAVEVRYEREGTQASITHEVTGLIVECLTADEWDRIAQPLGLRPLGDMGPLEEGEHEFTVTAVTGRSADAVTVTTAVWPKRPFDAWWREVRGDFSPELPALAGAFTVGSPAIPGTPCTNDSWYPMKRVAPSARMDPVSVWTGSEMIVWGGGSSATGALNTGGRYRPDIDVWTEVTTNNAPSARRRATAVWTGSEMIVWGGDDGASPFPNATNTGGRYNPVTDSWQPTPGSAPAARSYPTSVWTGSSIIVWGGYTPLLGQFQTGGVLNLASNSWTATSLVNAPSPRYGHTATMLGGEMVVWGGEAGIFLDTGARYNPASDTWVATTLSGNPGARGWHSAVLMSGRVTIWGGQRTGTNAWNTGAFYQVDSWTAITSVGAPLARLNHNAVVVNQPGDTQMVIYGGQAFDFANNLFDVGVGGGYRLFRSDWRPMANAGAPSGRHANAAVSTGDALLVWGGLSGSTIQGDGRRYDPFAETWSGMSSTGTTGPVPSARSRHTMVWTGSEALVWGGMAPSGFVAHGGSSYVPATDTWSALADAGAPSDRYWHTAVWTGFAMVVWGGTNDASDLGDGAYWDLFSWGPVLDTGGLLSPRRRHTAVWASGNRMILWGGDASSVALGNGARYYFEPNFQPAWLGPTAPAPLAVRTHHTAVWTGSRMIVYGGSDGLNFWADGASYDPAADGWTLLPALNAPPGRFRHTAVWSGSEMLVWGGFGTGFQLANGGRYSPSQNAWNSVSSPGLAARDMLEATWTGREMVVWSGRSASGAATDGARYNPGFDGWVPMTAAGAPAGRSEYRAVEAGDEALIWGGGTDTGGRYCASCAVLTGFEAAKDLSFSNKTTLVWTASPGVTSYAVFRGTIVAGTPLTNHTCFSGALAAATASDAATPAAGTGYYYVVDASNACSRTSLGQGTTILRLHPSCP